MGRKINTPTYCGKVRANKQCGWWVSDYARLTLSRCIALTYNLNRPSSTNDVIESALRQHERALQLASKRRSIALPVEQTGPKLVVARLQSAARERFVDALESSERSRVE